MFDIDKMRVVVIKEAGIFVGQCLEHDICTQGSSVDELVSRLMLTVLVYQEHDGTLEEIGPAPAEYWSMWDEATLIETDGDDFGLELRLWA